MTGSKCYSIYLIVLFALIFNGCSSSQQESDDLPANNVSNESLNQGNNANANGSKKQGSNTLGAETNNVTTDEFATTNPASTNAAMNQGMTNTSGDAFPTAGTGLNNPTANGAATTNVPATANVTTLDPNQGAQPAAATNAGAQEFTNPHMNWPGKGRVKYVRHSASKYAQPGGQAAGQVEQGEHPLVLREGEWSELSDGTFMQPSDLSEKGIGRVKK